MRCLLTSHDCVSGKRTKSKKRAQSSIEFTLLMSFMFFVFIVIFYIIGMRLADIREENELGKLTDLGDYITSEVGLASSATTGYIRTFDLPMTINGRVYETIMHEATGTDINHTELTIRYADKPGNPYIIIFPSNIRGNLNISRNATVEIRNEGGIIRIGHPN